MSRSTQSNSRRRFVSAGVALSGSLLAASESARPAANDTLNLIHCLRSIHGNFSDRQVSDADVSRILDASVRAANASSMQTYSIVVSKPTAAEGQSIRRLRKSGFLDTQSS